MHSTAHKTPPARLTLKLALIMEELARQELTALPSFGQLRAMLGRQRVMLLPSVKNHHEVQLDAQRLQRVTVVLEITLLDADSEDQLTTRWIGQAVDSPERCYERAVTHALEDFLRKTFLLLPEHEDEATLVERSSVRRRPQGASDASEAAGPAQTSLPLSSPSHAPPQAPPLATQPDAAPAPTIEPKIEPKPGPAPLMTLEPEPEPEPLAQAQAEPEPELEPASDPALRREPLLAESKPWKAANALWRALVSEVCAMEVMEAYEQAMERAQGVDSWRKISAEQLREWCHMLRRRSATPSDSRKLGEREEYILAQLEHVPPSSSLDRLSEELRRLCLGCVERPHAEAFLALYLRRMGAQGLHQVSGRSAIALCRKLRRLRPEERAAFILDALRSEGASNDQAPSPARSEDAA